MAAETLEKTSLVLIRHGQARAEDGSYDRRTPLSELGRRQSEALAGKLAGGFGGAVVYASPYPRALATSAPLCGRLGVEPFVDGRLAEFEIPVPSFEEASERPDLILWLPDHTGVEGGETIGEFTARVSSFFDEAVERHPGQRILVFAHSGTIDAAIRWALGFTPESPWQHDFDLANASITEIDFWPRGRIRNGAPRYAALRRVGDTKHLGDLVSEL